MEYKPQPDRYTNGMFYRRCGDSGIQLPVISLGFWHNFGNTDCYATGLELVEYAFDHGVCHFDLANNYGPPAGSAEENFGRMMKGWLKTAAERQKTVVQYLHSKMRKTSCFIVLMW